MKIISVILIIVGILLNVLQIRSMISFSQLHPEWIWESGKNLMNDKTDEESAKKFITMCEEHGSQLEIIGKSVLQSGLLSCIIGIVVILMGIMIFIVSKRNESILVGNGKEYKKEKD